MSNLYHREDRDKRNDRLKCDGTLEEFEKIVKYIKNNS